MSLFDRFVEKAKEIDPDFNENNPVELDNLTKSICLLYKDKGEPELYNLYLKDVVEECEKLTCSKHLKLHGLKGIEKRLEVLNFEKEILERKIKVARSFLS